jgi:hypothetical protein
MERARRQALMMLGLAALAVVAIMTTMELVLRLS